MQSFRQKMLDEADSLFESFDHEKNHYLVLYNYLFLSLFPEIKESYFQKRFYEQSPQ